MGCFLNLFLLNFVMFYTSSQDGGAVYQQWSIKNYESNPYWFPTVFEDKVHKGEENYTRTCTVDSPFITTNCSKHAVSKEPLPPFKACRIVISEINTDEPGETGSNIFVELEEICWEQPRQPVKTLKGFKLVVVEGRSNSLVMVVDLKNVPITKKETNPNRYVVIGTASVSNVNVKFTDDIVQSVYNNPGSQRELPEGDSSPFSVMLLYSSSLRELSDITLAIMPGVGMYEKRTIDEVLLTRLRTMAQDMVVYGRKAQTNRCEIFERLWYDDTILNPKLFYLLRDWDGKKGSTDLSLNRCTASMRPFLPDSFKLGLPTPGDFNDCRGARFVLEEHIFEVTERLQRDLEPVDLPESCHSDQINMPNERYKRVDEEMYLETRDRAMVDAKRQCLQDPGPSGQYAEDDAFADMQMDIIHSLDGTIFAPPYDKLRFEPDWIEAGRPYLPKGSTVLEDPVFQSWLRLRTTESGELRFYCDVCATQIEDHFHIERNRVKDIMKRSGFLRSDVSENEKEITDHFKSDIHASAEGYLREIFAQETTRLVHELIVEQETFASKLLLPTVRMVRSVYMETATGLSYHKHPHVVNLQKSNGVNLGIHAYHKQAAMEISDIVSDGFHKDLLEFLVSNDKDFTLLVDASTDSRNIPYLVVFIQTLEHNRPTIYFYRLIVLENGESAQATMTSLWNKILADTTPEINLEDYFLRRMIAFASDGANVMIGKRESLHVLLNRKLGRTIPSIICMAHKLQNAIKRGIKKSKDPALEYFENFENHINQFYNFYSSRGSKRWQHFEETARELGIEYRRIKYFFEVRWSSSQYSALSNIVTDYVALNKDTEAIWKTTDKSFTNAAKQTASNLFLVLQDRTWSLVLHYMLDILNIYKEVSEDLQYQAGTLPGKAGVIQRAIDSINDLRGRIGAHTSDFLSKCSCRSKPCSGTTCSIKEYEECGDLIYTAGDDQKQIVIELKNSLPNRISIFEKSPVLLDSLIDGLMHYFNLDDLKHFELFNQKAYRTPDCDLPQNSIFWRPESNEVTPMDANDHISYLGRFYGMTSSEIVEIQSNWDEFYRQLIVNPSYVRNLQTDFEFFWPLVLKNERGELKSFPNSLRSLIQKMLVTPFSTAECERAFSVLTSTMWGRQRLSPDSLEKVMRVRINGNDDYYQFKVIRPTQKYLEKHARVDDESAKGGRPKNPKPWSKLLPKSTLF